MIGAEALLRWNNPMPGLLAPARFLPTAEETGLIVSIGEWAVRRGCAQAMAWRCLLKEPLRVVVNTSSRHVTRDSLVEMVESGLGETGLGPACLELELTEEDVRKDMVSATATLWRLKRAGVRVSIDDLGTGYSSLGYLWKFPIDTLKIDRPFVADFTRDPVDAAIGTAIIGMAHASRARST